MDNQLSNIYSALSDPTRRAVIAQLTGGSAPVSDLFAAHDMAMPTFLKHIGKLEQAGLVRTKKAGRVRTVEIETAALSRAKSWIDDQQNIWDRRLDRLQTLTETTFKNQNQEP